MLFLTTYWHILSALGLLALALIRLYIRFHDLEKENKDIKVKAVALEEKIMDLDNRTDVRLEKMTVNAEKSNHDIMENILKLTDAVNDSNKTLFTIKGFIEGLQQSSKNC